MNLDRHNPSRAGKKAQMATAEAAGRVDSLADLQNRPDIVNLVKNQENTESTESNEDIIKQIKKVKKQQELLDKNISAKEEAQKRAEDEQQAIEWLKTQKISQIVVHGGAEKLTPQNQKKEGNFKTEWNPTPDTDAQSASIFLTQYNKNTDKELYTENAVSSIVPKGGNAGHLEFDKSKEGLQIWIDVGNRWMEVENKGEKKVIYFDHHGEGKRDHTSATSMIYEIMKKSGTLNEEPWMENYVRNITSFDNLSYIFNKKDKFTADKFQHEWPRTFNHLAREMHTTDLINLFKEGKIKNFNTPLTDKQLAGEIGDIKLKPNRKGEILTLRELVLKETSIDPKTSEVAKTDQGIQNSVVYAVNENLETTNTNVGDIIYHNQPSINGEKNIIPNHLAFLGTVANDFDTYISVEHPKGRFGNRKFFINSNHSGLEAVIKRLKRNKRIKLTDIRGVMIMGETNLTEREFLALIDKKIVEEANFLKTGELPKNIKTELYKENKNTTTKNKESKNKTGRPNTDEGIEDEASLENKNTEENLVQTVEEHNINETEIDEIMKEEGNLSPEKQAIKEKFSEIINSDKEYKENSGEEKINEIKEKVKAKLENKETENLIDKKTEKIQELLKRKQEIEKRLQEIEDEKFGVNTYRKKKNWLQKTWNKIFNF